MTPTSFLLPIPPSANQLWFNLENRGGRARTKRYEDWITLARSELRKQKARPLFGTFHIAIEINEKARMRDCDNALKPVLDLLVFHGVLDSDAKTVVRKVSSEWVPDVEGVRVTIKPVEAV